MKSPAIKVTVKKDKSYYWCSCGLSKSQPFCDGSHKNDEKNRKPIHYMSPQDKFISFCTCKRTEHTPICDGNHRYIDK